MAENPYAVPGHKRPLPQRNYPLRLLMGTVVVVFSLVTLCILWSSGERLITMSHQSSPSATPVSPRDGDVVVVSYTMISGTVSPWLVLLTAMFIAGMTMALWPSRKASYRAMSEPEREEH